MRKNHSNKKTVKKISEFYQASEDFIYQNKVPSIKEIQNKDKTSVLLDSNILLDVFLKRTPFFKDSYDVFNLCLSKKIHGIIAAHSITNLWYILRKDSTETNLFNFLQLTPHFLQLTDLYIVFSNF